MNHYNLNRRLVGEALGTGLLLTVVVGSGIMGDQLSRGNTAIALLANSLSTGAGLVVLILMVGTISGAHFNPVVNLIEFLRGNISKSTALLYICAQMFGAFVGVAIAHLMFEENVLAFSSHARSGPALLFSEFIATFGLVAVIRGVGRNHSTELPYVIGLYITAAYWFTASTSFANPAITLARAFTPTFAGIKLENIPAFWVVQVLGALSAEYLFRWFDPLKNFRSELSK